MWESGPNPAGMPKLLNALALNMPVSPSSSLSLSVSVSHYGPLTVFAPAKKTSKQWPSKLWWESESELVFHATLIAMKVQRRDAVVLSFKLHPSQRIKDVFFSSHVGWKLQLLYVVINLSHTFRITSLLTHSPRVALRIYLAARLSWTCTTGSPEEVWSRNTDVYATFSGWTNLKSDNLGTRSVLSFVIFKSSHPVICQRGPSLGDTVRSDRCPLKLVLLDHTCHILTVDA